MADLYDKIGFVVAMHSEADPILNKYPFIKIEEEPYEVYVYKKYYFIITGVGTLNAAVATELAILRYDCRQIINFGVAGFTGNSCNHGDIFSVNMVYKRDVDLTLLGYPKYQYPGCRQYIYMDTDPELPVKTLFTSDTFISSSSEVPMDVLVDMEGYAVAFAAWRFRIECRLIKAVSDKTSDNVDRSQYDDNLPEAVDILCNHIKKYIV